MRKTNKTTTRKSKERIVNGRSYAWLCDFGLCRWSDPDRVELKSQGIPSPEAKIVAVRIIMEKDYQRLIAK